MQDTNFCSLLWKTEPTSICTGIFYVHKNFLVLSTDKNQMKGRKWKFKIFEKWRIENVQIHECLSHSSKIIGSCSQTPIMAEKNIFNILSEGGVKNLSITTVMACLVLNCYSKQTNVA